MRKQWNCKLENSPVGTGFGFFYKNRCCVPVCYNPYYLFTYGRTLYCPFPYIECRSMYGNGTFEDEATNCSLFESLRNIILCRTTSQTSAFGTEVCYHPPKTSVT